LNAMICTPGWLGVQITGWVAHGASLLTHITNQEAECIELDKWRNTDLKPDITQSY
jgi:hypothetical protein